MIYSDCWPDAINFQNLIGTLIWKKKSYKNFENFKIYFWKETIEKKRYGTKM